MVNYKKVKKSVLGKKISWKTICATWLSLDLILLDRLKLLLVDTPCVHGYLDGMRFASEVGFEELEGNFTCMQQCAESVRDRGTEYVAAMVKLDSGGSMADKQYDAEVSCYGVTTTNIADIPDMELDPSYTSCFLKGSKNAFSARFLLFLARSCKRMYYMQDFSQILVRYSFLVHEGFQIQVKIRLKLRNT